MTARRLTVGETLGAVGLPGNCSMAPAKTVPLAFALAVPRLSSSEIRAE